MKIAIHGVNGKMGQEIARAALLDSDCELSAVSVRDSHSWANRALNSICDIDSPLKTTSNLEILCQQSDVIIDFTRPDATLSLLPICQRYDRPMMIGTTGFNAETAAWIERAARHIPIVFAANTSLGVNVLMEVAKRVASVLPAEDWDVEIFESHHRRKVDAPSGTALKLGEQIALGREVSLAEHMVYPYENARKTGDIGFSVMRGGEISGEHTVYFINDHERLEFTHRAHDRSIFARGALIAAKWLQGKPAGLYSMADVLGFRQV